MQRRLKLPHVSPKLVELFRDDHIGADQMMALALSDSHDEQECAWFDAQPHDRHASAIRRKLVAGERDFQNSHVALYVSIDTFEAAGSVVRRDLFSDTGTAWYSDQALIERVALEQLRTIAADVLKEGWAWVEPMISIDYNIRTRFAKIAPTDVPATDERLYDEETALSQRYAAIEESLSVDTPSRWPVLALSRRHKIALAPMRERTGNILRHSSPSPVSRPGFRLTRLAT
ncbi:hypothetical protein SB461_29280 [Burkholderia cenocepacia]|uniref:hypothetical protein n=1 Tax=Burkholderia cepacia complex TaxID=87882 RepID=UPI002B253818|nr:hypothetical protein [Burkholderia cenocepacia]MEB2610595.1 hypothetical protein [Burkholderia cenocepacia]